MSAPVESVMTRDVAAVGPDASVETILGTLDKNQVSGVPVVSETGKVLGVVSEGDLILKVEHPDLERARYWMGLIESSRYSAANELAGQLDKVVGKTARDLMSSPAITVHPDASVAEAAQIMRTRHVKRLPVVDASDRIVGIVSRADLARSLISSAR